MSNFKVFFILSEKTISQPDSDLVRSIKMTNNIINKKYETVILTRKEFDNYENKDYSISIDLTIDEDIHFNTVILNEAIEGIISDTSEIGSFLLMVVETDREGTCFFKNTASYFKLDEVYDISDYCSRVIPENGIYCNMKNLPIFEKSVINAKHDKTKFKLIHGHFSLVLNLPEEE